MITALEIDARGKTVREYGADALPKHEFRALTASGRLVCPCCKNTATHVMATRTDGGFERTAHFRAEHTTECLYINDPRSAERVISFRQAIDEGKPILININMDNRGILGFEGEITPLFNVQAANPASGLMSKHVFAEKISHHNHLALPAHDVGDVLYYLEMAKELGGQKALDLLYFNTLDVVQSCRRFIVCGPEDNQYIREVNERKIGRLVSDMALRAPEAEKAAEKKQKIRTSYKPSAINRPRKPKGYVVDTPRLFYFTPTQAQIREAEKEEKHQLYGDFYYSHLPEYGPYEAMKHPAKLAMRFNKAGGETAMSNRTVLKDMGDGRGFWVMAVPSLNFAIADKLRAKIRRTAFQKVDIAFLYLRIRDRRQYLARENKATPAPTQTPTPAAPKTTAKPVADEPYQRPANDWRLRADLQ